MSNIAVFGCNILQQKKKIGELKMDDKGYREIVVGGLDVYNDVGELYPSTPAVQRLFDPSSDFMQNMAESYLRGEAGHPRQMPGEADDEFLARALDIDVRNTTHHFNRVRLEPGRDENGRPILLQIASFKPSGVHGPALETMASNPEENIAFSIRAFTKPVLLADGTIGKELHHIVTWDLVNRPGIKQANKYDTPSMESAKGSSIIVTPELLDMVETNSSGLKGFESSKAEARMVKTNLGWQKLEIVPAYSASRWGM